MSNFFAHGKLLLTAEYVVLDGVLALAVPTRLGQSLTVEEKVDLAPDRLEWRSEDENGAPWFTGQWQRREEAWVLQTADDETVAISLDQVLQAALCLRPAAREMLGGWAVTTRLDFPRDWGLGSSSTLVSLVAQWLSVDPYLLLAHSFGGSGYDVACAQARQPILFQYTPFEPQVTEIAWQPPFKDALYFVHLGKKQDSRAGIRRYRERTEGGLDKATLDHLNVLTIALVYAQRSEEAEKILRNHERLISELIGLPPVRQEYFADFPGAIKSLGAWGGDFVMALSPWDAPQTRAYFNEKGYSTVLGYDELINGG